MKYKNEEGLGEEFYPELLPKPKLSRKQRRTHKRMVAIRGLAKGGRAIVVAKRLVFH